MKTEIVRINSKALRKEAKRKGLSLRWLSLQCGKSQGYFFDVVARGRANREIAEKAEEILGAQIIDSNLEVKPIKTDIQLFRRMRVKLTEEKRREIVECMLDNKSPREAARIAGVCDDTAQRVYDDEWIASERQKEELRQKRFRPRIIRTGSGIMYTGVESRWKLQEAK